MDQRDVNTGEVHFGQRSKVLTPANAKPQGLPMKRRDFIRVLSLAAGGLVPMLARAQEGDSIWDMMSRGRVLNEADREANSVAAMQAIDTVEPVLSYDTANNLLLAIAQYEPFVVAGGWDEVPQEAYPVSYTHLTLPTKRIV